MPLTPGESTETPHWVLLSRSWELHPLCVNQVTPPCENASHNLGTTHRSKLMDEPCAGEGISSVNYTKELYLHRKLYFR